MLIELLTVMLKVLVLSMAYFIVMLNERLYAECHFAQCYYVLIAFYVIVVVNVVTLSFAFSIVILRVIILNCGMFYCYAESRYYSSLTQNDSNTMEWW